MNNTLQVTGKSHLGLNTHNTLQVTGTHSFPMKSHLGLNTHEQHTAGDW